MLLLNLYFDKKTHFPTACVEPDCDNAKSKSIPDISIPIPDKCPAIVIYDVMKDINCRRKEMFNGEEQKDTVIFAYIVRHYFYNCLD